MVSKGRTPLMTMPTLPAQAKATLPTPKPMVSLPAAQRPTPSPLGAGAIRTGLPQPAQLAPGQEMRQRRAGPTGLPAQPRGPVGRPAGGMMAGTMFNRTGRKA